MIFIICVIVNLKIRDLNSGADPELNIQSHCIALNIALPMKKSQESEESALSKMTKVKPTVEITRCQYSCYTQNHILCYLIHISKPDTFGFPHSLHASVTNQLHTPVNLLHRKEIIPRILACWMAIERNHEQMV